MAQRFRDFDAWEAERSGEPLRFRIRGQDYELPASLPAIIPIRAMRLQREYGSQADVPPDAMLELACSLFGDAQLERLLASGIDVDALGEILQWAVGQYTGSDDDRGNPPPPAAGEAPRS